jgi:hypothetical protein
LALLCCYIGCLSRECATKVSYVLQWNPLGRTQKSGKGIPNPALSYGISLCPYLSCLSALYWPRQQTPNLLFLVYQ